MIGRKVQAGRRRGRARDGGPLTPGRLFRQAPLAVWILVGLHGLLLLCWSVLTPQFHAPDEPNHVEAVMRLETGQGWGRIGHTFVGREGVGAIVQSPYGTPSSPFRLDARPIRQSDAVPRDTRPAWDHLDDGIVLTGPRSIQQIVQHPPGYYWLEAGAVALTGGADQPWDRAVGVMRVLSALLIAPLPLLAWAATFRLVGDHRAALAAAIVPLAIPQLSHVAGSVNNDSLLIFAGGLVTVGIACVLRGDRTLRTALFCGVSLGVALFSKSLALALIPVVFLAYLVPWIYARRQVPDSLDQTESQESQRPARPSVSAVMRPMLVVAGLAFAIGGWWYAANILRYGAIQPGVPGFPPGKFLGDDNAAFANYATKAVLIRYWGNFGWFETSLPFKLVYAAAIATTFFLAVALVRSRRPRGLRWALLVMLAPTALTYVLMVKQALSSFLSTGYYSALTGRYLFVGIVGAAVVVGVGASSLPKFGRWAPLGLLVGAGVMQAVAVTVLSRRWWEPAGGSLRQVWGALSSWSPWSPRLVEAVVAATAVLLALAVVELLRSGYRDEPSPSPVDEPPRGGRDDGHLVSPTAAAPAQR